MTQQAEDSFEQSVTKLLSERGWSHEKLAETAEIDVSTVRRILTEPATRDPRRRQSVQKIVRALDASDALFGLWAQTATGDGRFERTAVSALNVQALPEAEREREFAIYQETVKPIPGYTSPPSITATSAQQTKLDALNPFPGQLFVDLSAAFDLPPPWDEKDQCLDQDDVWPWCRELGKAITQMWTLPTPIRRARLDVLEEVVQYLSMSDDTSLRRRLRDVDIVFVLCGRGDHEARVSEASAIVEAAIDEPPLIVVSGSPALLTTDSLLSEPDAVWHSLKSRPGATIDLTRVVLDARAIHFSECAALAVGHLFSRAEERGVPLTAGLVAGRLSMRRGWWIFRRAFDGYDHIVQDLVPLPAGKQVLPSRPDSPSRLIWEEAVTLELRKLLFTRLAGVA